MKLQEDYSNIEDFENLMTPYLLLLWNDFQTEIADGIDYERLQYWQRIFEQNDLTFDFGLDAEPYDFELQDSIARV